MDEVAVALISLSVSTIVSMILNLLVYAQNKQKHYSTTISQERMAWIKETRIIAANFIAFCENNDAIDSNNSKEFYKLKNLLLLNLNIEKKYINDVSIRLVLENSSFEEIKANTSKIRTAFSVIFKSEWDKAKVESGRSKYYVKKLNKKNSGLRKYYLKNQGHTY